MSTQDAVAQSVSLSAVPEKPIKRRAPKLPAHLSREPSSIVRPSGLDTISEGSESVACASNVQHDTNTTWERPSTGAQDAAWEPTRFTHSPFMRSAIVQGTAPRSRVAPSHVDPTFLAIKPVLGLQASPSASQTAPGHLQAHAPQRCDRSPLRSSVTNERPRTPPIPAHCANATPEFAQQPPHQHKAAASCALIRFCL